MSAKEALEKVNLYISSRIPFHVFLRFTEIIQSMKDEYYTETFLIQLYDFFTYRQSRCTINLQLELVGEEDKFQELLDLLEGHIITTLTTHYTYQEKDWVMWRVTRIWCL